MAGPMTARLAVDALPNAVALRHPSGTVVHLDRGSQFRSHAYLRALRGAGLHGSMGRVGACADNAAMETLFSLLQNNVLNRRRWATREQLRLAIVVWIQRTYHRHRRQDSLGRLTPIAYETPYAPLTPHGSTYPTESTKVGGRPLNLGPHPYQLNAGNRCAYDRFRRSRPTVGARSYAFNQRIGMRSSGLESTHTWLLLAFGTTSYRILCTARLPAVRSFLSQGCSGCDARPSPCATGEEVWRGGAGPGTLALSRFQAEGPGRWRSVIGCSRRSTPAPGPRVAPRAGG
jgi:hypothetical protein